jgi:signal transduction histidine kinase
MVVQPQAAVPMDDLRSLSILIVDDEEVNVRMLARILGRAGFTNVRTTTSSPTAVEMFAEAKPDLMCMDVHMPELDGFAVLARVRAMCSPLEFLPILAITGDASPETRQGIIVAGAKDFLEKPFEAAEVVVRVENLLTTRLLHRTLQRQNELLELTVSERTAELRAALAVAEAASHTKTQFLAAMSHELRTPLNAVIGFARHLQKNKAGNLSAQDLTFVQRIADAGGQLLHLIDDILDFSRVGAAQALVERAPVSLPALVADVVHTIGSDPATHAKGLTLAIDVPAGVAPLDTDEAKLRRILTKLLQNAVKFTEAGVVRVVVSASAGVPQRIDVIDTGIGIHADRMNAIFEHFEQAETGARRSHDGAGLGLAIARALCELLGFRLSVVSELGVGSAFSILLDRDAQAPRSYGALAAYQRV